MPLDVPPAQTSAMVAAADPFPRAARQSDVVVALRPARGKGLRSELVQLSPRRLKRIGGVVRIPGSDPQGYAVAPDGRRVAIATQPSDLSLSGGTPANRITVVRRKRWTRSRTVTLPAKLGTVVGLQWLRASRLLVFTRAGEGPLQVSLVDPLKGRRRAARSLEGFGAPRAAGADHVAVLSTSDTSRADDGKAAKVLFLDTAGQETGRAELGDVTGPETPGDSGVPPRPSYTTDPVTGHILALAGSTPLILDVDPATAAVTPHPFPPVAAGPEQQEWAEGAFDGKDLAFTIADGETGGRKTVPVDRATLTPGAPAAVKGFGTPIGAGEVVLFPSGSLSASSLQGIRAVTPAGAARWTAEPDHRSSSALPIGDDVYADVQGIGSTIIDARTGKTAGQPKGNPFQLLDPTANDFETDQPWFGFGGSR